MEYFDGWAVPDGDNSARLAAKIIAKKSGKYRDLEQYQENIRNKALEICGRDIYIDIGANIGLWACQLSHKFNFTHAFEINQIVVPALKENIIKFGNPDKIQLHEFGLSNREKTVSLDLTTKNSFGTHIKEGLGEIPVKSLDSVLENVNGKISLIKIDAEGSETYILCGMIELLMKHKPVIIIEEKNHGIRLSLPHNSSIKMLEALGAVYYDRSKSDFIYHWPELN